MAIASPTSPPEFHFDSSCTSSPFITAPSSPNPFFFTGDNRYSYYTSAPASPSRFASTVSNLISTTASDTFNGNFFKEEDDEEEEEEEEEQRRRNESFDDFVFEFSGHLQKGWNSPEFLSADELFDKGKIKASYPSTPITNFCSETETEREHSRGRSLKKHSSNSLISTSRSGKGSRSLSPKTREPSRVHSPMTIASVMKTGTGKKWRLKDLFLFRSASEGRVADGGSKDFLGKYALLSPSASSLSVKFSRGDESKYSSFRSVAELHKAAAAERKKKTALPYKQSLFGCLRLNPAINGIAKGFNSYSGNRRNR